MCACTLPFCMHSTPHTVFWRCTKLAEYTRLNFVSFSPHCALMAWISKCRQLSALLDIPIAFRDIALTVCEERVLHRETGCYFEALTEKHLSADKLLESVLKLQTVISRTFHRFRGKTYIHVGNVGILWTTQSKESLLFSMMLHV